MSNVHAPASPGPPTGRRSAGLSRRRGAAAGLVAVLLAGSTIAGCSTGDGDPESSGGGSGAGDAAAKPLRVPTRVTRVLGDLSQEQRQELAEGAQALIAGYLEAAYLHQRPDAGYRGSFPGFTPGGRARALRDTEIASDAAFAGATEVQPRGAAAYVSVVAPEGQPKGATARVSLDLAVTEGTRTRRVTVSGRLLLTPREDQWLIFGYDLAMAPTPARGGNR